MQGVRPPSSVGIHIDNLEIREVKPCYNRSETAGTATANVNATTGDGGAMTCGEEWSYRLAASS
jgi:hypothetical protein